MREETAQIKIRGMICRSCTDAVEETLLHTPGVISARVSYIKGRAELRYDPDIVSLEQIEKRIEASGYDTGDKGMSAVAVDIICIILTAVLVLFFTKSGLNPVPEAKAGASLGYIFLIGLLTSTHCLGMCGGIMLSQTASGAELSGDRKTGILSALYYNGGRVLSYTAAGAVFGALGTVISYTSQARSAVFTAVGLAVLIIGVNMWGLIPGLRALSPAQSGFCSLPKKGRKRFAGRPLAVGLLTGLMPCGSMYAMWLLAITGGSALYGAEVMLMFSLGTVPLMFVFGALNSFIPKKLAKYMLKLSAVLVTALGIKMLLAGLG